MNTPDVVATQYKDDRNLSARMDLHAKYSTNQQGFYPWLFQHYGFQAGCRILELGCGNGAQWQGRMRDLPADCIVVVTDYSAGMVGAAWERLGAHSNLLALRMDIQEILFPDESFDIIIANHMLYHVPDLPKALSEVRRTLRRGGRFFAATNGDGGMKAFLRDAFRRVNPQSEAFSQVSTFSLQNGEAILRACFEEVARYDYEDSLAITETRDLMDWIRSAASMQRFAEDDLTGVHAYFEELRARDGAIHIPKEIGLFVAARA